MRARDSAAPIRRTMTEDAPQPFHLTLMGRLREAFSREHGLQCGFCTPGMLIAARDICQRLPQADEERIRVELSGNLCRCTGYVGIVNAVKSVAMQEPALVEEPVAEEGSLSVWGRIRKGVGLKS